MKKEKRYCGIDISNKTIDVCIQQADGTFRIEKFANSAIGFAKLLKITVGDYHFVMESTGVYHLPLCFYLQERALNFSVVNALQIKRYIQMRLARNKSDKKDAKYICEYGIDHQPLNYQMPDAVYFECRAMNNAMETITNEITAIKNKIHSLKRVQIDSKLVVKCYQSILKKLMAELKILETALQIKLKEWQPELTVLVQSVVGIGKRATARLIISTQGFKHTKNYKQLISYAGLSPREYSSGTSIRGKARICKLGGGQLRHTLYMCALNAKKTNRACKQLFDRLVANGKNKKLAVIAVCNKLLKQVFAVVNSGVLFDKNYLSKTA
jgi:transposase